MQEIYKEYETEELVMMYQGTEEESYLREIMQRNMGLFNIWAYQYSNIPGWDIDDLLEEIYIACWKAVKNYDVNRGVKFVSCLGGYVEQSLNRIYGVATRKKRCSWKDPISYEVLTEIDRDYINWKTVNSTESEAVYQIDLRTFIDGIGGVTKEVAEMLCADMAKKDISKVLGITSASTSYHVKKIKQAYTAYFGAVRA